MSTFVSLMRRADTMRRAENDPERADWWAGYIRGLRRAHHGEQFGTQSEHEMWMSLGLVTGNMTSKQAVHSASRAALGRGYRAGLTMEARDPSDETLAHCQRCERYVVAFVDDLDLVCPHCKLVL